MTYAAAATKDSELQFAISGVNTEIPGLQSVTPDPGENKTWDDSDIVSDYETQRAAGVGGGGSIAFTKTMDPLDPVDQALHAIFNNGGVNVSDDSNVDGVVVVGSTGVEWAWEGILTKYGPKAEKAVGWMIDGEFKLADRMALNESDPA